MLNDIERVTNEIRRIDEDLEGHKDNKGFIMRLDNMKECKRVINTRSIKK